jgi:symplekin
MMKWFVTHGPATRVKDFWIQAKAAGTQRCRGSLNHFISNMSMRPPQNMRGGGDRSGSSRNESIDDPLLAENDNLSDDDNAQVDIDAPDVENEDPLLLAIDDLEGRVVAAVDEMKIHPGVSTGGNIHEELAILLRPVLEVAAHTGPSVARTYYRGAGPEGVEASVEDAYERTVSDLALPVMLEMAQSDANPIKRVASLEFFRTLYKECHKAGSWLDMTTTGIQAGPYGPGGSHHLSSAITPAMRVVIKRRQQKRLVREGELLRYWLEAAVACLGAVVLIDGRAILAASAALRPALQHIAQRIRDADDRGAARLFAPVMKMVEPVLRKLFVAGEGATHPEEVRAAAIKFLEILLLCCSHKPQDDSSRRKGQGVCILLVAF